MSQVRPKLGDAMSAFREVYEDVGKTVAGVGTKIGGKVNHNINIVPVGKGRFENACAIRMSYVLNKSGVTVPLKKLIFFFAFSLVLSGCSSHGQKKESKEEVLFRNYVMAVCLGTSFEETKLSIDANRAANGYMEFGSMPLEAYEESRSAVDDWLSLDYSSKSGDQIDIMKCIDLFRSEEVGDLYGKHSPCKTKGGWLDPSDYQTQCE